MKRDDVTLAAGLIVAMPFVHLTATSLFLWGYTTGFGGELRSFISINDIFSFSIKYLVQLYLFIGLFVAIGYLVFLKRFSGEIVQQIPYLLMTTAVVGLFLVLAAILLYYFEYIEHIMTIAILFSTVFAMPLSYYYSSNQKVRFVVTGILFLISCIIGAGFNGGYNARNSTFAQVASRARCNNFAIIQSVSNMFIAVHPSNRKALITAECEIRFVFP